MLLATFNVLAFECITIDLFGEARHLKCAIVVFGIGRDFKPKMSLRSFHNSSANTECKLQQLRNYNYISKVKHYKALKGEFRFFEVGLHGVLIHSQCITY